LFNDIAIKHLINRESLHGGFEYSTCTCFKTQRCFIDVDVQWEVTSLSVATFYSPMMPVLAIDLDPLNVTQLLRSAP